MKLGVGLLFGLLIGIAIAEWLGNDNNPAYYSVVFFGALVGSMIGRLFQRRKNDAKD